MTEAAASTERPWPDQALPITPARASPQSSGLHGSRRHPPGARQRLGRTRHAGAGRTHRRGRRLRIDAAGRPRAPLCGITATRAAVARSGLDDQYERVGGSAFDIDLGEPASYDLALERTSATSSTAQRPFGTCSASPRPCDRSAGSRSSTSSSPSAATGLGRMSSTPSRSCCAPAADSSTLPDLPTLARRSRLRGHPPSQAPKPLSVYP
jgi:hypothetical protein